MSAKNDADDGEEELVMPFKTGGNRLGICECGSVIRSSLDTERCVVCSTGDW